MDYVNPSNFNPSNFSALIYDSNPDNPAIFPNPEMMVYDSEKPGIKCICIHVINLNFERQINY